MISEQRARRAYQAQYMKTYRSKKKAEEQPVLGAQAQHDDPISALCEWASKTLIVPAGHPAEGTAMAFPPVIELFVRKAWPVKEAALIMARKNGKSSGCSVVALGLLLGPLRRMGFRIGVASLSKAKANELMAQVEGIAKASGLDDQLTFYRSPQPGKIVSSTGTLELLSSETGGHASGFDLVLCDELGLFRESERAFVASLRSSVSAKDGRFWALSIFGHSPFVSEIVARRDDPDVCVHLYQSDKDARLDDETEWYKSNPGLGTIKSLDYMRRESKRVLATPSDQGLFRAFDLNCPQDPAREMICGIDDFKHCIGGDAERDGVCVASWDCGGSDSMTTFCALWPWTGRCEIYGGFPATPTLQERGQADAVGSLYLRLWEQGELEVFEGRITPVAVFLERCFERLAGEKILLVGCDRYRKAEAQTALTQAGLDDLPVMWRGQGAASGADGSHDCRAFSRLILQHKLRVVKGAALLSHAIEVSSIRRDASGNPALSKGKERGRIDALQAAVIAAGLSEIVSAQGKPSPLRMVVVG